MTPKEVLALAEAKEVKLVDFRFCDLHGRWLHFTTPILRLTEEIFEEGIGFDGSSIRGWKSIDASDMLVIPDPKSAFIDPFTESPMLSLICDIEDPLTREPYERSPRGIARNAELYLRSTGIADTAYFGPEAEFFIFDNVRYKTSVNESFAFVDSEEGAWNSGLHSQHNPGYTIALKEGALAGAPMDRGVDIRHEMVLTMMECGLEIEREHHEVGTAGQSEIDLRYNTLLSISDDLMKYKHIVKNIAFRHGKTATFMPKPLFGENGSGMHVHSSLWKKGKALFAGDGYAGLSDLALYYIGGILHHAPALCALTNPTNNSYKRLIPGFEAPVVLAYSARNRSAICRIPTYSQSPQSKRVEFRCPDPSANPYLAFSAILMAGLDGIEKQMHPGDSMDKNLYDLPPEEARNLKTVPDSLRSAVEALVADHAFLLKGNVFTEDFIENYCEIKMAEFESIRTRPHPHEFELYFDV